jgi:hypothetical protein
MKVRGVLKGGSMYNNFEHVELNEQGKDSARKISHHFQELTEKLEEQLGNESSRELSLVFTKLQEACFFAKTALNNNPNNQEHPGR